MVLLSAVSFDGPSEQQFTSAKSFDLSLTMKILEEPWAPESEANASLSFKQMILFFFIFWYTVTQKLLHVRNK